MVGNRGFQDARTGKCVPLARQESQMDAHRGFERPRTSKSVPLALRVSQMVGNRGFERPRTSKPVPLALWGSHSGPPSGHFSWNGPFLPTEPLRTLTSP
jgi:hypothetical protein